MASMYCPYCGGYVGDCGHVAGGTTDSVTLSGTCPYCNQEYSVTCDGDCLPANDDYEVNVSNGTAHGPYDSRKEKRK